MKRRVLFVWTGLTSYMADSWRRLAADPGIDLRVVIDDSGTVAQAVAFDARRLMVGIDWAFASPNAAIGDIVAWHPDVIFAVGWHSAVCRTVVESPLLRAVPKVCCFDMPWRWQLRCLLAPLVLRRFLRGYRAAFVPGTACERYAKWLGFRAIHRGLFAIDVERFSAAPRRSAGAPGYLLYVGRDSGEKRLDDLREAHRRYLARGGKLELRLHGKGLANGFAAPDDIPALMRGAAAVVLASEFDPWPLVLLEAMSAGCPVIASDRCMNRLELGRNWRVFKCGDVAALTQAFFDAETPRSAPADDLELARQYDCRVWAGRVKNIIREVVGC